MLYVIKFFIFFKVLSLRFFLKFWSKLFNFFIMNNSFLNFSVIFLFGEFFLKFNIIVKFLRVRRVWNLKLNICGKFCDILLLYRFFIRFFVKLG